jgi:hypothetical protein
MICDKSSQAAELENINLVCQANGYALQDIIRVAKAICSNKCNKRDHTAYLPRTTDRIASCRRKKHSYNPENI